MGEKEGEKNGGDNKVAPVLLAVEKKDDVSVTAIYKFDCSCAGCVRKIEKAARHLAGVEEVKIDRDANKLTVKGTNVDATAIREKLEKKIKKKVELVSPQPKKDGGGGGGGSDKKPEVKKAEKKEEPKKPIEPKKDGGGGGGSDKKPEVKKAEKKEEPEKPIEVLTTWHF